VTFVSGNNWFKVWAQDATFRTCRHLW